MGSIFLACAVDNRARASTDDSYEYGGAPLVLQRAESPSAAEGSSRVLGRIFRWLSAYSLAIPLIGAAYGTPARRPGIASPEQEAEAAVRREALDPDRFAGDVWKHVYEWMRPRMYLCSENHEIRQTLLMLGKDDVLLALQYGITGHPEFALPKECSEYLKLALRDSNFRYVMRWPDEYAQSVADRSLPPSRKTLDEALADGDLPPLPNTHEWRSVADALIGDLAWYWNTPQPLRDRLRDDKTIHFVAVPRAPARNPVTLN